MMTNWLMNIDIFPLIYTIGYFQVLVYKNYKPPSYLKNKINFVNYYTDTQHYILNFSQIFQRHLNPFILKKGTYDSSVKIMPFVISCFAMHTYTI